MKLNRIPSQFRALEEYAVRARFEEFIGDVPVLASWELTNTFRDSRVAPRVELARTTGVKWVDSLATMRDTISRPH
jgi:hypothetical protein